MHHLDKKQRDLIKLKLLRELWGMESLPLWLAPSKDPPWALGPRMWFPAAFFTGSSYLDFFSFSVSLFPSISRFLWLPVSCLVQTSAHILFPFWGTGTCNGGQKPVMSGSVELLCGVPVIAIIFSGVFSCFIVWKYNDDLMKHTGWLLPQWLLSSLTSVQTTYSCCLFPDFLTRKVSQANNGKVTIPACCLGPLSSSICDLLVTSSSRDHRLSKVGFHGKYVGCIVPNVHLCFLPSKHKNFLFTSDLRGHLFLKTEKETQRNCSPKVKDTQFPVHCSVSKSPFFVFLQGWARRVLFAMAVKRRWKGCPAGSQEKG